jgi:sorting nexin-4
MFGDEEDVFDSVTWEAPPEDNSQAPTGPGFRQSVDVDSPGPNHPKWEGYLITTVRDPVKELAETKDAYVSYLVSAKVRSDISMALDEPQLTSNVDQLAYILNF